MLNFNMVISKLWGVCRTQSCDPPRGLEIIFRMSNTVELPMFASSDTLLHDSLVKKNQVSKLNTNSYNKRVVL
jgi:hypothetical protein